MASKTPLRTALRPQSPLHSSVNDGLGAVLKSHKAYFHADVRGSFADSLDIDSALKQGNEQANRWDYLLGHDQTGEIVAVEPHSAKEGEISTVIAKRKAALAQLRSHLRDGVKVTKWLWVSSGTVQFVNTEKARKILDQNGIEFVGKTVLLKHLPR